MKNNLIKEEISRIREIMGFSLLVESKLPSSIWDELVTTFSKTDASDLESSLKNMDSSVNSLTKAILDTESKLGTSTDEIIAGLRAGTLTDDIVENLFANVLKQGDSKLKQAFLYKIDDNIYDIFKIAADSNKIIKTTAGEKTLKQLADLNQLDSWVNAQKKLVDESNFDPELTAAIKKQIDNDVAQIKKNVPIEVPIERTWKDWYNEVYLADAKRFGKKAVTEEDFISQAKAIAARTQGIPPDKVVDELIRTAKDKQGAIEYITNFFKKNKVGDGLEATADGAIKVTEKGAKFLKTLGGIGIGGLLTTGILLAIFNPEFYVDLAQKYREAGAKYNDQYNILLERFGDAFKKLPDELKQFLSNEFSVEELKTSRTSVYLKSFNFTPNSNIANGSLVVTMSDETTKEYETPDNKTFTLTNGTPGSGSNAGSAQNNYKTTNEIIDAIKKEEYNEPITLDPNENGKTNYKYKDRDGLEGTVEVTNTGDIIVK